MIIKRQIQRLIENSLFKNKIVIIYGARQVGKTTLIKQIQKNYISDSSYLNCDEIDIRQALTDKTSTELKSFSGSKKLIIIDEAQRVKNIGLTLKLIIDNFPKTQVIAAGSSSFDLSNKISEPLTCFTRGQSLLLAAAGRASVKGFWTIFSIWHDFGRFWQN